LREERGSEEEVEEPGETGRTSTISLGLAWGDTRGRIWGRTCTEISGGRLVCDVSEICS
jgi:hypothetical protein